MSLIADQVNLRPSVRSDGWKSCWDYRPSIIMNLANRPSYNTSCSARPARLACLSARRKSSILSFLEPGPRFFGPDLHCAEAVKCRFPWARFQHLTHQDVGEQIQIYLNRLGRLPRFCRCLLSQLSIYCL